MQHSDRPDELRISEIILHGHGDEEQYQVGNALEDGNQPELRECFFSRHALWMWWQIWFSQADYLQFLKKKFEGSWALVGSM